MTAGAVAETREPDLDRLNALIDAAFDAVLRSLIKADPYGALDHDVRSAVQAAEDRRTRERKANSPGDHPKPGGPATEVVDRMVAEIEADRRKGELPDKNL